MSIERELKFRLVPHAAARAVRELSLERSKSLSSIYYDTRDAALSGARSALRLRRDGRRWLQAFKCEMAPGARGEWEIAVPRAQVDVHRWPLGEIRAASGVDLAALAPHLRPLFETRFMRRAAEMRFDDATIEVAVDRGHVVAGKRREPICELEIELKSGAPSALLRYAASLVEPLDLQLALQTKAERGYRLARGDGIAPPRKWRRPDVGNLAPREAFARLMSAALEQVAANAHGVLSSDDAEYLHQLRVGLRRLRALVGAFRALEPESRPIKRRLRAFGPVLGAARDRDVFLEAFPSAAASAARARARDAARALVASASFNEALLRILRWIEEAPWRSVERPLTAFAADALERLHGKALKAGQRMTWSDAPERHALRIRVKRLRYAADAFADCFPPSAVRAFLAALETLQDDFGALNDIAVARRLMGELPEDPSSMVRKLALRERRLIARVRRDWKAFAKRPGFWRAER